MAGYDSRNQDRHRASGFEGFLHNLQNWDASEGGDSKLKLKGQVSKHGVMSASLGKDGGTQRKAAGTEAQKQTAMITEVPSKGIKGTYTNINNSDIAKHLSTSLFDEEGPPTAASEKELGNEYFKQKNFPKAVECYSRSIALSPTSVAFANRAMAYLKMKRYEEAETDCSEALNLDDRYVKAYSRRATARKELGKLKLSLEDSEFALRLEPNNQELRRLYTETKALYNDEVVKRMSGEVKRPTQGPEGKGVIELEAGNVSEINSMASGSQMIASTSICSSNEKIFAKKQEQKPLVHELPFRAASLAMSTAPRNLTPPKSAYEFEVSWRHVSSDCSMQANILKSIPPDSLPQLFKNALSAPMLIEIIKCTATFFKGELELAISILENLTRVSRFDMIVMCFSALDRAELLRIWNEAFSCTDIPSEHAEKLTRLRQRYCPGG
ncbi:hypothetical protein Taro_014297 [Colocasia esculenta]|uniref:RNA-polymerase II-associated protein 3-like C-terminal domain-containing protein n=1 Tax=Colocasia esculenta TaxID=4460 RepID=A0A843ULE6_COLES|nr:hypothetical protein [Colocasia esculenta]